MARSQGRVVPRVTIRDVAKEAGVSVSTVSNALNGRTAEMTDETWRRIQDAMQGLKYHRNSLARGLVTNHTASIGVILAEVETPLFLQALHVIEPIVRGLGYSVLLSVASTIEDEKQALNLLLEKQVDGLIFYSTSALLDDSHLVDLQTFGLAVVLVNRVNRHPSFDQINWDNRDGISQAMDHLVSLGHRRIAHLKGPDNRVSTAERLEAYHHGLQRHGLGYDGSLILRGDYTTGQEDWWQVGMRLLALSPRPTAVIASDDAVAATVMRAVQTKGLRVPEDMAIIGIDDQPFASYLNPPLTSIRLPVIEAGRLAAETLLRRMADPSLAPEHVELPCRLVIRASCGAR